MAPYWNFFLSPFSDADNLSREIISLFSSLIFTRNEHFWLISRRYFFRKSAVLKIMKRVSHLVRVFMPKTISSIEKRKIRITAFLSNNCVRVLKNSHELFVGPTKIGSACWLATPATRLNSVFFKKSARSN